MLFNLAVHMLGISDTLTSCRGMASNVFAAQLFSRHSKLKMARRGEMTAKNPNAFLGITSCCYCISVYNGVLTIGILQSVNQFKTFFF